MSMNCRVCGGPLKTTDKKSICSDACKQKRYRDRASSQKRAYDMGFQIDAFSKMLTEGLIDASEARSLMNAVWDRIWEFNENIKRVEAVEAAREDKPKRTRRR